MLLYMYQIFSSLRSHLHFFVHFFFTIMEYFFFGHPILLFLLMFFTYCCCWCCCWRCYCCCCYCCCCFCCWCCCCCCCCCCLTCRPKTTYDSMYWAELTWSFLLCGKSRCQCWHFLPLTVTFSFPWQPLQYQFVQHSMKTERRGMLMRNQWIYGHWRHWNFIAPDLGFVTALLSTLLSKSIEKLASSGFWSAISSYLGSSLPASNALEIIN